MKRIKAWVKSFFGFSQTETNAFLLLIPLIVVIIFSESIFESLFIRQSPDLVHQQERLDSIMQHWQWRKDSIVQQQKIELFEFNPNTSSKEELLALGFSESLSNRIINYRSKNGVFKIKSDVLKMYGMDTALYLGLKNYILLPETYPAKEKEKEKENTHLAESIKYPQDLNTADSVSLTKVYGIGPKLSQRIINYRTKLGGFVSAAQLKEVYGLDSAVIKEIEKKFSVDREFAPKQLNINTASEKELAVHPYIGYKLAKAIVTYRFQHGSFQQLEDLTRVQLLKEADYVKMKPYLTY